MTRTAALVDELVRLARELEPLTGSGRSAAVWSLDGGPELLYAGPHARDDVLARAAARLRDATETFDVDGEPGVTGRVVVLGAGSCAYGLFLHGAGHPHVGESVEHLIDAAERSIGKPASQMSRTEKQVVVRFLDERGAFLIRKAVEDVADRLGVTRFTVYNYLDRDA
ncbi:MAG TPA: helix-turn-helix domain-containing protein [Actinomycetota bacterium]|nr:helix-turn-helix domain-containing protein [Actinomycetota bacterium]